MKLFTILQKEKYIAQQFLICLQFWFNMGPFWDQPYDKVSGQSQGKTSTKNQMKDMGIFLSLIPHSFLWGTPYLIGTVLKVTASTTTRSTTRCSGDQMGDQIALWQPDCSWATRSLLDDQILDGVAPFGQFSGPLKKMQKLHLTTWLLQATRLTT